MAQEKHQIAKRKQQSRNLHSAKQKKNDEFYTQLADIEKEIHHYNEQLKGKAVFCNCDDPYESNFFRYFALNFNKLGLKQLITTSYKPSPIANTQLALFGDDKVMDKPKGRPKVTANKFIINEVSDMDGDGAFNLRDIAEQLKANRNNEWTPLEDNGDFRSDECIELLKKADVVVTNPPFSLFREYVAQLIEYDKQFIIVGNINAITYKECFKLIKQNKLWLGLSHRNKGIGMFFDIPKTTNTDFATRIKEGKIFIGGAIWYTNLDNPKNHEPMTLYKKYQPDDYPKYDNYDAIEVSRSKYIPVNYDGVMGVPITFLNSGYNSDQFDIVGQGRSDLCEGMTNMTEKFVSDYYKGGGKGSYRAGNPLLGYYNKDGKATVPYMRILIRKRERTR